MAVDTLVQEPEDGLQQDQPHDQLHEQRHDELIEDPGAGSWGGIRWQIQEPHVSGLGNLSNPFNGCYAAVALQLLVATEVDLNLSQGNVFDTSIRHYFTVQ